MTKLEEIEKAITVLSEEDLAKLREWFAVLDAQHFDEKIERDALSGKLDALAKDALTEHARGLSRKL